MNEIFNKFDFLKNENNYIKFFSILVFYLAIMES